MNCDRALRFTPALCASLMLATPAVGETCFTAFNGTVHYQFQAGTAAFTKPGAHSIPGILFGALSACAGLSFWSVVGTATNDGKTTVLGLRDETADDTGCGGVDLTVSLSPTTLSGPVQLYNDRNSFGNTTTMTHAACVTPPNAGHPAATGRDALGNSHR